MLEEAPVKEKLTEAQMRGRGRLGLKSMAQRVQLSLQKHTPSSETHGLNTKMKTKKQKETWAPYPTLTVVGKVRTCEPAVEFTTSPRMYQSSLGKFWSMSSKVQVLLKINQKVFKHIRGWVFEGKPYESLGVIGPVDRNLSGRRVLGSFKDKC